MKTKSLAGVLLIALLLMAAATISAQEVTQAEKDKALQYLETTKKNVLEATKGLSEAQWNFKPARSVRRPSDGAHSSSRGFSRTLDKEKVMMAPAGDAARD